MMVTHLDFAGRRMNVRQEFFSIKNQVYLVQDTDGKQKVLKRFRERSILLKERENLLRFSPVSPELLEESEESLLLEHIPGRTLLDCFAELEETEGEAEILVEQIAKVLERLHALAPGYRLGDMNCRNFILDEESGQLRFVDFEEACQGDVEEDTGRMLAFLLTYRPVDTEWKRAFVVCLADKMIRMGQDADLIRRYAEDELSAISERRNIPEVALPEGFAR